MMLSNTGIVSSSVVIHLWKLFPIPGHPLSAIDDTTIQQIEIAIFEDRRVTERHVVKISVGDVEKFIHDDMGMEKVSARWIPQLPTPLQKKNGSSALKLF